jgi:hypothetical protein
MTFLKRVSYFSIVLAGLQCYISTISWFLATIITLWEVVTSTRHNLRYHLYYSRMIIQYLLHFWKYLLAIAVDHILGHYSHHFSVYLYHSLHCYLHLRVLMVVLTLRMHLFVFRIGLGLSIYENR